MGHALVSLGSNLGDRTVTLDAAVAALGATPGIRDVRASSWYETAPIGGPLEQDPFLNGAVLFHTSLSPAALLERLQQIEAAQGRRREIPWGPRTLDLDLLLYDDVVLRSATLTLPHPRLSFRKFVLRGAVEVARDMQHPILRRSLGDLWTHLESTPRYVAFVGREPGFRTQLAAEAADAAKARLVEPTPDDVPSPAMLATAAGPTLDDAVEFFRARNAAIAQSLAAGAGAWIVDDAWWPVELAELAASLGGEEQEAFLDALQVVGKVATGLPPMPRLLISLGDAITAPCAAALEAQAVSPVELALPPVVELDISRREDALLEFAAALEAAT